MCHPANLIHSECSEIMADVHPLSGWRYDVGQVGDLSQVTCPPYDVIDAAFQEKLYQQHPCNVIRLELNREEPGDATPDDRYARAAGFLRKWIQQGVLIQEHEASLYVYHQVFTWEGHTYTRKGFMGRIRLERFGEGKVYPHEQTLSGPKADRLKLLKTCQVNFSPIFGLYPDETGAAQDALEKAILGLTPLEATDHLGVLHRLWPVSKVDVVNTVRRELQDKPVFIADGHHRYETGVNYRDELAAAGKLGGTESPPNFTLMHFCGMSDPGLVILPTHRLVTGVGDLTAEQLKQALSKNFDVQVIGEGAAAAKETWELIEADGSQGVLGFGTTADNKWSLAKLTDASPMLTLAPQQSDAWRELAVSVLHKLVLDHLLPQAVPEAKAACKYVHLLDEVTTAQAAGQCQLGCLVPPAQISHVEEIAEKLEKMPPKSTYFYPKLQTGLVFNSVS